MNDLSVQFVEFIPTPNEKTIGIATIKLYGRLLVRYKILPNKEGTGFFSSPSSLKIIQDGQESFLPCFVVDSRSEETTIKTLIHDSVKRLINPPKDECPF